MNEDDVYRDVDTLQRFLGMLGADDSVIDEVKALKDKIRSATTSSRPSEHAPEEIESAVAPPTHDDGESNTDEWLQPGKIVCLQHDPSRQGALMSIEATGADPQCQVFLDGIPQYFYRSQLQPYETVEKQTVVSLDELHCVLTSLQVRHPSSLVLHSLNAARIDFVPYQYRPALKIIRSDQPRLLIADGVGVGKTIEAGLILRELQARHNVESVLVICPKPLVAERKWEREMRRFDEHFTHLDGKTLQYCISEMDMEGEWPDGHRKTIIPYSLFDSRTIRGVNFATKRQLGLVDLDPPPKFDLVIVDEAHHVRNSSTYAHQAVRFFTEHAEAVVFLTATPIQMGNNDLFVLLNLLRPDLVIDKNAFSSMAEPNPHINAAVREARAGGEDWCQKAADSLDSAAATSWGSTALKENLDFKRVRKQLQQGELSREERVRTIHQIESFHSFSRIISRTRRRDVGAFCIRRTETVEVPFTDAQAVLHDGLIGFERSALSLLHGTKNIGFMITTIRRQASSCIFGLAPFIEDILERRLGRLGILEGMDAPDDDSFEFNDSAISELRQEAEHIFELSQSLPDSDPKYESLKRIVDGKQSLENNKVIVFSTFRHTLAYIRKKLSSQSVRVGLIHGGIDDQERVSLRARFEKKREEDDTIDVMLFSEVGCEGLDYQFCDTMVNYDLPWNPMRIEQRIGRIDRRGQRSEVVSIYNFITPGTVDADIYTRCLLRINVFEANIGECEEILGQIYEGIQRIAGDLDLTQAERQAQFKQLADNKLVEIEHQRELEDREQELFGIQLPKSQADTDIQEAESNWLGSRSLQRLASKYLEQRCGNGDYFLGDKPLKTLRLSKEARATILEDFRSLSVKRNECSRLWEKWLKGSDQHCTITFESDCARNEPKAIFVTAVHPLTLQAAHHFSRNSEMLRVEIRVSDDAMSAGTYPFAIYAWEFVGVRPELQLIPICESEEVRENLFSYLDQGIPVSRKSALPNAAEVESTMDRLENLQWQYWEQRREEHRENTKQRCSIRDASLESSFSQRIKHLENQLAETTSPKIAKMRESQIAKAKRDWNEKRTELKDALHKCDIHTKCVAFGVLRIEDGL